jgi:hypothetical protein
LVNQNENFGYPKSQPKRKQNPTPASASASASAYKTNKPANLELSSPDGDGALNGKISWRDSKFDEFWNVVWAKIGRGSAYRAWKNGVTSPAVADQVIAAAQAQGENLLHSSRTKGHSILHPATWINGERWLDEAPAESKADWELT